MSISNYINTLDMSDDMALEASGSVRKTILGIITKIKEFLKRAWDWIRTKLYNFFKIDAININKELYYDCIKSLDILNTIAINVTTLGFETDRTKEDADDTNNVLDSLKLKINKVSESNEYKRLTENNYSTDKVIAVKTGSLKSAINSLEKDLESLEKTVEVLEKWARIDDANTPNGPPRTPYTVVTQTTQMKISILSKLISNGKPIRKE